MKNLCHKALDQRAKAAVVASPLVRESTEPVFSVVGTCYLSIRKNGAITSLELFGIDELIIFSYWVNRHRYHRTADIGANLVSIAS